jgi:serine/threonine protein kinase
MGRADEEETEGHASCPDAGQLVELARGSLDSATREEVLAHVRSCAECDEVLRLWTQRDLGKAAATASAPAPSAGRPPGPGDILASKYRVERVLGIGGMGMVVAATHLQLGRVVALKLMLPETAASPETAARFIQEARAAAEVQSEHVVRVLDVGSLDDGSPYMVMEFLRGNDFARLLRTHGPLPVVDVAGYILQACEAVAEAHALGIVHRDLKPANLFLTTRADGSPLVKVLDFGISKLTRRGASGAASSAALTKTHSVMGTPLYMSPEQLRNTRSVGPGTDIWSLGCILYELLAGRPAFLAGTAEALGALIATGPAPRIREARPNVPGALEDVIVRCLEKDPGARFASIGELAREIGPFAPPDMTSLVGRVARISARPVEQLPFADTVNSSSERPPRFSGTGAGLVHSRVATTGRRARGAWPFGIGGTALAAIAVSLMVSRSSWRTAPSSSASSAAAAPTFAASPAPTSAEPAKVPESVAVAAGATAASADASEGVAVQPATAAAAAAVATPVSPTSLKPPSTKSSPSNAERAPNANAKNHAVTPKDRDAIE